MALIVPAQYNQGLRNFRPLGGGHRKASVDDNFFVYDGFGSVIFLFSRMGELSTVMSRTIIVAIVKPFRFMVTRQNAYTRSQEQVPTSQ